MDRQQAALDMGFPGGIECLHGFPDESPDDSEIETDPGWWSITEAIIRILESDGYVSESVEPEEEHSCWLISLSKGGEELHVRVYALDEVIISAEKIGKGKNGPGARESVEALLRFLWREMERDGRFRDIEWLTYSISGLGLVAPIGEPGPRALRGQ